MKDVDRFTVMQACAPWMALVLACALPAAAYAGSRESVWHDIRADLGPTIFISAEPPVQPVATTLPTKRKARQKPMPVAAADARPAVSVPPAPGHYIHSGPFDIPEMKPRAGINRSAMVTLGDVPAAKRKLSVHPRFLFDARRNALPANWLQVDPANQVPLMRQAVGVDSEYVRRLIGVEVGYSASGSDEKSRFLFDVRTTSLDQETVRAAVGIPLD